MADVVSRSRERVAAELAAMPSPSEALDAVLREAVLSASRAERQSDASGNAASRNGGIIASSQSHASRTRSRAA